MNDQLLWLLDELRAQAKEWEEHAQGIYSASCRVDDTQARQEQRRADVYSDCAQRLRQMETLVTARQMAKASSKQ